MGDPPPAVWIVLVNYNGLADTRRCLESLAALRDPASVVVVDNASADDPTAALAAEFPTVAVVRSPVNGGWAGGNNVGIRYALDRRAEFVLLLNNDTEVDPALVGRLLAAAAAHPQHGVLGPVVRDLDPPHAVQIEGIVYNTPSRYWFFQQVPVPLVTTHPPTVADVDIVNGCCLFARRDVFERVGRIDDALFLMHEESDFCLRAGKAGFRCGVIAEALVRHKGGSSFQREGGQLQRYFDARNTLRVILRHRGGPGRRSLIRSLLHYVKYLRHRYGRAREAGFPAAADAAIEGLYDVLTRRFGPRPARRFRPGLSLLRGLFAAAWRLGGGRGRAAGRPVRG